MFLCLSLCVAEGMSQFRFEAYQVSNQAEQLLSRGWFADLDVRPLGACVFVSP